MCIIEACMKKVKVSITKIHTVGQRHNVTELGRTKRCFVDKFKKRSSVCSSDTHDIGVVDV